MDTTIERREELLANPRSVFISYTHDSIQHKNWVSKLANDLRVKGFDVVRDEDEILDYDERLRQLPHIMSLSVFCRTILFITTSEFMNQTDFSQKTIDAGYIFEELNVIFYNVDKRKYRIISILREGQHYHCRCNDGKVIIPMIDFRNDLLYEESLEYLIHYLSEGLNDLPDGYKVNKLGYLYCTECSFSYPYSEPPPKVCNNCQEIYSARKWLCPKCDFNKFRPLFLKGEVLFSCPSCNKGILEFIRLKDICYLIIGTIFLGISCVYIANSVAFQHTIANLSFTFVFAVIGGYGISIVARSNIRKYALMLGIIMAILSIVTLNLYFGIQPIMYQIILTLIVISAFILGIRFRIPNTTYKNKLKVVSPKTRN